MKRKMRAAAAVLAAVLAASVAMPRTGLAEEAQTFSATEQGCAGEVTVTLTFDGDVLADVTAEGASETPSIGGRALELLPQQMLAANSVEVDGVSGATFTSNAVLAAAAAALEESGITLEAREVSTEQAMTPGTYYGEAYGYWKKGSIEGERFGSPAVIEPTRVAVTVDETSIISVEVESCSDTPGFIDPCIERIPAAIVENQSIAVDGVTGATMTSQAILSGVTQALEEAGADLTGFMTKPEKSAETEEYTVELAIVGAGAAGTMAALVAKEHRPL